MKTSSIQERVMSCIIEEFRWMEHDVLLRCADLTRWALDGDDDGYLGYGGVHPGAVWKQTLSEELVWWHVGLEKPSQCPLTKLFERCLMAGFYESRQMFANYLWQSTWTLSSEKQVQSKLFSWKKKVIMKACKASTSLSFLGQNTRENLFPCKMDRLDKNWETI